ncbi:DUF2391 family protein [Candidatus Woesearchaeota archaeon]|nr:DUF2391 family protein [Candidatus Woesearchaeota archaeon]
MDREIAEKLNKILETQGVIQAKLAELLIDEKAVESEESSILATEEKLLREEKALEKGLKRKVLGKISFHDVSKGVIGSFFGTIGHFAFFEGAHIAEQISMTRATILYIFAYGVGSLLIYFSGFRKVKEERVLHLVPLRVTVMFVISIVSSVLILYLFNQISFTTSFDVVYKIVANVSVLAMFGATTADFLGD